MYAKSTYDKYKSAERKARQEIRLPLTKRELEYALSGATTHVTHVCNVYAECLLHGKSLTFSSKHKILKRM